jgi:hypothetical protein
MFDFRIALCKEFFSRARGERTIFFANNNTCARAHGEKFGGRWKKEENYFMGNHRLLERAWEKRKWEREMGESGRFSEIRLSTSTPPTHARDDEAFSEGSEVHFVLMFSREHVCRIVDTRMVLQVNLFV